MTLGAKHDQHRFHEDSFEQLLRMFPKQSCALWGSGTLKAGGRWGAPARGLRGLIFVPEREPQPLYENETPVAAERRSPFLVLL